MAKSGIWATETTTGSAIKFCRPRDVQYLIMNANFCEDWLRSFGMAKGKIMGFLLLTMQVCDKYINK